MPKKGGKKILTFYNNSGSLDNIIKFLEEIKKKVNYLNLNCTVEGKHVKISLFGPRDLQYLAVQKLRELAIQYLD